MRIFVLLLLLAATPPTIISVSAQPLFDTHAMPSSRSGIFTAAQAERGHQMYLARCSGCHKLGFSGNVGGQTPPAFGGPEFNGDFDGYTVFDLENRIHTTMPLGNPGSTNQVDATDLTAFILSQMGNPPGAKELPPDNVVMQALRIDVGR